MCKVDILLYLDTARWRFILWGACIYSFHCNLPIRLWHFQPISEAFDLTMEQDTYISTKVLYGLMDQGKNTTGILQLQLKCTFTVPSVHTVWTVYCTCDSSEGVDFWSALSPWVQQAISRFPLSLWSSMARCRPSNHSLHLNFPSPTRPLPPPPCFITPEQQNPISHTRIVMRITHQLQHDHLETHSPWTCITCHLSKHSEQGFVH